ncbi:MAG: hypothetical protein SGARI_002352 [Bacillariaceae sp.]
MVSIAWKELPEDERETWEEKGRKDKARYEMEKAMYTGPWKVPVTGKRSKDPTRPKRPMSAFLSYSNRMRSEVKEKHKDAKTAEISRILAQMWKEAPPEEKKEFIDEEFKLRTKYKVAMAEWKERTEKEAVDIREARESEAMKLVLEGKLPPDPFPTTNATSLPAGNEYGMRMADEAFSSEAQRQTYAAAASVAGYAASAAVAGADGPVSSTAAAFQPPLDPTRRGDYSQMYGAYMQPHLYGYPSLYGAGYGAAQFPSAPAGSPGGSPSAVGAAAAAAASGSPGDASNPHLQQSQQQYLAFPPYYRFDPNAPFGHPPY